MFTWPQCTADVLTLHPGGHVVRSVDLVTRETKTVGVRLHFDTATVSAMVVADELVVEVSGVRTDDTPAACAGDHVDDA